MTYPNPAGTDTRPGRGRLSRRALAVLYPVIPAVLMVAIGGLWMRGEVHRKARLDLQERAAVVMHLQDVRSGMLAARDAEKSFLLSDSVNGVDSARHHATSALSEVAGARRALAALAALDREAGLEPDAGLQDTLKARIGAYEAEVREMVKLAERVRPENPEMRAAQDRLDGIAGEIEDLLKRELAAAQGALDGVP